ncbi:MAG: NAD-dependent epimerase/dehydratase family protein [Bacteroidia bacterium]|nr:NAD-dependent epimerase/dehydratase family protein [Bacteroidia bacterium]
MSNRILVIGAGGQLGTELVQALAADPATAEIHAADLRHLDLGVPSLELDVVDKRAVFDIVDRLRPTHIYHLAAILSAAGERNPALAWQVNLDGLMNVLDAAVAHQVRQVFWPSSIAAFGPNTPRQHTPQHCTMDPNTVYGITKLTGERLVEYYHARFDLDVRSLRYPGLISWKTEPGGGTTDYAIHIFHEAIRTGNYLCFLEANTRLPMMYIPDAVKATLDLMAAPAKTLTVWSSYNLGAISFTPAELAAEIERLQPGFTIEYAPDFRQQIATSWPESIDDSQARADWGWAHTFGLEAMARDMYTHLKQSLGAQVH